VERLITLTIVGVGPFVLTRDEALALAVRLRELAPQGDPDAQAAALTFETSIAAAVDTVIVGPESAPLLRDAVAVVIDAAGADAPAPLLKLQRALEH
jgi:hypothetical protein